MIGEAASHIRTHEARTCSSPPTCAERVARDRAAGHVLRAPHRSVQPHGRRPVLERCRVHVQRGGLSRDGCPGRVAASASRATAGRHHGVRGSSPAYCSPSSPCPTVAGRLTFFMAGMRGALPGSRARDTLECSRASPDHRRSRRDGARGARRTGNSAQTRSGATLSRRGRR